MQVTAVRTPQKQCRYDEKPTYRNHPPLAQPYNQEADTQAAAVAGHGVCVPPTLSIAAGLRGAVNKLIGDSVMGDGAPVVAIQQEELLLLLLLHVQQDVCGGPSAAPYNKPQSTTLIRSLFKPALRCKETDHWAAIAANSAVHCSHTHVPQPLNPPCIPARCSFPSLSPECQTPHTAAAAAAAVCTVPQVVMVELCKERVGLLVDTENEDRRLETWHCR